VTQFEITEVEMPVSAVSRYRGGTVEGVTPLAKAMKAVLLKHGVSYRVSRFQTEEDAAEWLVVVQYADWQAYEKALDSFAQDPDHKKAITAISKVVTLVSREMVVDLDL
jgi:hypothetical protein